MPSTLAPTDAGPVAGRHKRKWDGGNNSINKRATPSKDGGQKKFKAKVSQLVASYNALVYRPPPDDMGKLTERMRALANLLRAGGSIGNWRIQEDIRIHSTSVLPSSSHF